MSWEATGWAWKVKGLGASERLILLALANFANRNHECWPSVSSLIEDTGLSERTIRASTKALEERALITKRTRQDAYGRTTSSVYYLSVEGANTAPPPATIAPTGVQPLHPTPATIAPSYNEPVIEPVSMNHLFCDASQNPKPKSQRGTRISEDWNPSQDDYNQALSMGLTVEQVDNEANKFRDYWIAKAGSGGVKLNWSATWRNWCRTAKDRSRAPSYSNTNRDQQKSGSRVDAALRALQAAKGFGAGG